MCVKGRLKKAWKENTQKIHKISLFVLLSSVSCLPLFGLLQRVILFLVMGSLPINQGCSILWRKSYPVENLYSYMGHEIRNQLAQSCLQHSAIPYAGKKCSEKKDNGGFANGMKDHLPWMIWNRLLFSAINLARCLEQRRIESFFWSGQCVTIFFGE